MGADLIARFFYPSPVRENVVVGEKPWDFLNVFGRHDVILASMQEVCIHT